jgi:hypothetical protein
MPLSTADLPEIFERILPEEPPVLAPERRLLVGMLCQAIRDCGSGNRTVRTEARQWMASPTCVLLCDFLSLSYRVLCQQVLSSDGNPMHAEEPYACP